MALWRRSVLGRQKVLWKAPPPSLQTHFLNSFLAFSPTALGLGFSIIVKVLDGLGAKRRVCLLGLFAADGFRPPKGSASCSPKNLLHWYRSLVVTFEHMVVASEKGLRRVAPAVFPLVKGLLLQTKLLGRFRQLCFTLISHAGVKLA